MLIWIQFFAIDVHFFLILMLDYIMLPIIFQYFRRITFKEYEERREGAEQLMGEAKRIAETFTRLAMMPAIVRVYCV